MRICIHLSEIILNDLSICILTHKLCDKFIFFPVAIANPETPQKASRSYHQRACVKPSVALSLLKEKMGESQHCGIVHKAAACNARLNRCTSSCQGYSIFNSALAHGLEKAAECGLSSWVCNLHAAD